MYMLTDRGSTSRGPGSLLCDREKEREKKEVRLEGIVKWRLKQVPFKIHQVFQKSDMRTNCRAFLWTSLPVLLDPTFPQLAFIPLSALIPVKHLKTMITSHIKQRFRSTHKNIYNLYFSKSRFKMKWALTHVQG